MPAVPPSFSPERNSPDHEKRQSWRKFDIKFLKIICVIFCLLIFSVGLIGFFVKTENKDLKGNLSYIYLKGRHPDFVGRQRYFDFLAKEFLKGANWRKNTNVKVLWGKGGYGKSELAIEFANRYFHHFSLIWTFVCDSRENIDQGYRHLAEKLGISFQQQESLEKLKEKVHLYLENHSFRLPWFLIYDNVENETIDYPQRGGVVLVTSQKKVLNPEYILEVEPFSTEESIELLAKITKEKQEAPMERLAEDLGGIPLLINYAAHYIKSTPGCTVEEYQKVFSSYLLKKRGLLFTETDINHRYFKSLTTSWQFALNSLQKENPRALEWLYICSYLYPEHISEKWINAWLIEKLGDKPILIEIEKGEIFKSLENYGIIRYDKKTNTFSLHRFFQHMIRETRKEFLEEDLSHTLGLLAKYAKDFTFENFSTWDMGEWWYLHACEIRKWLDTYHPQFPQSTKKNEAILYEGIANWCGSWNRYVDSLEMDLKALKLRMTLSEDNTSEIGMLYYHIGWNQYWLSQFDEALQACSKAKSILGHPLNYAKALNQEGLILWELGEYEKALECHQAAFKISKENCKEPNLAVAESLNNIARCHRELKQFQEALIFYEEALELYRKVCGEKHILYILCLRDKTWTVFRQGDYPKTHQLFHQLLPLTLQNLKEKKHISFSFFWNDMGWYNFYLKKDYKKARKAFRKALESDLTQYGHNSYPTKKAYEGLGWSYLRDGHGRKGLRYLIRHLQLCSKIYSCNPKMKWILEDFYAALVEAKTCGTKEEERKKAAELAYPISESMLGQDHPLTLSFEHLAQKNYSRLKENFLSDSQ